jgi:hypothetical protein
MTSFWRLTHGLIIVYRVCQAFCLKMGRKKGIELKAKRCYFSEVVDIAEQNSLFSTVKGEYNDANILRQMFYHERNEEF